MQPTINFDREIGRKMSNDDILRLLGKAMRDIYNRISGAGSANITVTVGSSSGSSGTSAVTEYRSAQVSVVAGSNTVTFSTGLSTTNYQLFCWLKDSDEVFQIIDTVGATKGLSGFTIDTFQAGTLIYLAIITQ